MNIRMIGLSLLAFIIISQQAYALTLRERLIERLATRHHADEMDEVGDSSGNKLFNPSNATVQRDIAYGNDQAQRFDVYIPNNKQANAPVIMMVHGGGWRRGDKAMSRMVENKANRWLAKGIIFVSIIIAYCQKQIH